MKKISLILAFAILVLFLGCSSSQKVTKDPSKIVAPFDGVKFNNIEPFSDKSFFTVLRWRLKSAFTAQSWPKEVSQSFFEPETKRSQELKVSIIGHATALIQMNDINILTDPHFSERASPVSWAGPRRVVQPGIPFEKLPPIDIVVISHDHYDALDIPTLKRISKKWGSKIYVGLGNLALLKENNIKNVFEMDWWDRVSFKDIEISFVPVQHWSARSIIDKRETLWGGFVIHGSKQVFFAGDTGYGTGKVFKMIHRKLGDMDLSLIPIGAYRPRYFMKNAHVWPAESVKIFLDTKSKKAIGIHFGTFANLTDEAIDDPPKDLKRALIESNIPQKTFIVPEFGRTYSF